MTAPAEHPNPARARRLRRAAWIAFGAHATILVASLGGTWALFGGVHVPSHDYATISIWFAVASVLLGTAAALVDAIVTQGLRRALIVFAVAATISFGAELFGTITGLPFGHYAYTDKLGPLVFGRVPAVLPLSWFMMVYPALLLATRLRPSGGGRALLAAPILTLWDVAMDPACTAGFACWMWSDGGFYFGMPLSNWMGWLVTGWAIAAVTLRLGRGFAPGPLALPLALYTTQGVFLSGLALVLGRGLAAAAWAAGYLLLVGALWWRTRANRAVASEADAAERSTGIDRAASG